MADERLERAYESGDPDEAGRHSDEAASIAEDAGAKRVLFWVERARADLAATS